MRAALELLLVESDAGKPATHTPYVHGLTEVGSAGQRELGVAERKTLGRTAFDQRQGLQRLDGRARVDRPCDVAPAGQHGALGIDDDGGAAMHALHAVAARDLDQHGIGDGVGQGHRSVALRAGNVATERAASTAGPRAAVVNPPRTMESRRLSRRHCIGLR